MPSLSITLSDATFLKVAEKARKEGKKSNEVIKEIVEKEVENW